MAKTKEEIEREYNGVQVGVVEGKVFVLHASGKGVMYVASDVTNNKGKVVGRRVQVAKLEAK